MNIDLWRCFGVTFLPKVTERAREAVSLSCLQQQESNQRNAAKKGEVLKTLDKSSALRNPLPLLILSLLLVEFDLGWGLFRKVRLIL